MKVPSPAKGESDSRQGNDSREACIALDDTDIDFKTDEAEEATKTDVGNEGEIR